MISGLKVERAQTPLPTAMAFAVAAFAAMSGFAPSAVAGTLPVDPPNLEVSGLEAQVRGNAQAEQGRFAVRASRAGQPPSGRYVSESGEAFIFDGTGALPLFRFERRTETWVLRPTPAPRGDVIYRNDAGAQILRVTHGGGVTLYTVRAPNGSPASLTGGAEPLTLPTLGPIRLFSLMNQRGSLVSQALGRLVVINLTGEESEALMVDALVVTTDAVIRMARSPTFRAQLAELRSITFIEGSRASVSFQRGDLRVVVNPSQSLAGRPSSSSIIRAVANAE